MQDRDHRPAAVQEQSRVVTSASSAAMPDDKLDVMRQLLIFAGVRPAARRSAKLTAAIVQPVASGAASPCCRAGPPCPG